MGQGVATVEIWNATQAVDVEPENILCESLVASCRLCLTYIELH
jgi:hypothetical protein